MLKIPNWIQNAMVSPTKNVQSIIYIILFFFLHLHTFPFHFQLMNISYQFCWKKKMIKCVKIIFIFEFSTAKRIFFIADWNISALIAAKSFAVHSIHRLVLQIWVSKNLYQWSLTSWIFWNLFHPIRCTVPLISYAKRQKLGIAFPI